MSLGEQSDIQLYIFTLSTESRLHRRLRGNQGGCLNRKPTAMSKHIADRIVVWLHNRIVEIAVLVGALQQGVMEAFPSLQL